MEEAFKTTTNGRAVIAACGALEKPLKLTRVAFGAGKITEDVDLADMHTLLQYVADGTIGERRHEEDRLYLSIQYANDAEHAGIPTFALSEFMIYSQNPVDGTEIDFIYGTMGDYTQIVPIYRPGYACCTWDFPLTTIVSSELTVIVDAPSGLVRYDDLIRLLNSRAAGAVEKIVHIPTSGWAEDTDTGGAFSYHLDIASMDITEDMVPLLNIQPVSMNEAEACGFCQTALARPGYLRVYTKRIPETELIVSLALLNTAQQPSGLSTSAAVARLDITIPTDGWTASDPNEDAYPFQVDIVNETVKSDLIPVLIILPEHLPAANACGLSTCAQTLPGMLRVYAKQQLEAPICASLVLLGVTGSITGSIPSDGENGYIFPVASSTTLGGVRVKPNSGLIIDANGNLSLDAASSADVTALFNGSKSPTGQE